MKRVVIAAVAATALLLPAGAPAQELTNIDAEACITPVVPCAFETASSAVALARAYVNYLLTTGGPPHNLQEVCYLLYDQPCAT